MGNKASYERSQKSTILRELKNGTGLAGQGSFVLWDLTGASFLGVYVFKTWRFRGFGQGVLGPSLVQGFEGVFDFTCLGVGGRWSWILERSSGGMTLEGSWDLATRVMNQAT